MKRIIKGIPVIGPVAQRVYQSLINRPKQFHGSENYWIERYDTGGNSGTGSYDKLAEFKAEVLNKFVSDNNIRTIIEYGCGDGNQLKLASYPSYIGFDVSPAAISLCKRLFSGDDTKTFRLVEDYKDEAAQLTISLDVVYHLVEDGIYNEYMVRLFDSAESYVIIYSTNISADGMAPHVKHRKFTEWVETDRPEWKLLRHIPNRYPYEGDIKTGSAADFYIFSKS